LSYGRRMRIPGYREVRHAYVSAARRVQLKLMEYPHIFVMA
jgi:hypothetical protein